MEVRREEETTMVKQYLMSLVVVLLLLFVLSISGLPQTQPDCCSPIEGPCQRAFGGCLNACTGVDTKCLQACTYARGLCRETSTAAAQGLREWQNARHRANYSPPVVPCVILDIGAGHQ